MSFRDAWTLDPDVVFLNHGSFGATPRAILEQQRELRAEIERQPVHFFSKVLIPRLGEARERTAAWIGADPASFAFVDNATTGVNTVLRSLDLGPDDELLVTDHEYGASRNALDFVAERSGAKVVVVEIPLPIVQPADIVDALVERVTDRTRLLLVDHITSQTGLVMPMTAIVEAMKERGVEILVDGAHGPGMLPLQLDALGATYYVGNFHKWGCAPKAAACLVVSPDARSRMRPVTISHGAHAPAAERFHAEFDWTGTRDPTPMLLVPRVIDYLGELVDGGWPEIYHRNRTLALEARSLLHDLLGTEPIAPDEMIGSLAAVRLPDGEATDASPGPPFFDPIQDALVQKYGIEVPVIPWPAPPRRMLRVSAHLYNERADYERLTEALSELIEDPER